MNFCQQQRELIDILEQRFLLEATLRASVDLQFVDHGKVLQQVDPGVVRSQAKIVGAVRHHES
ncbi:hypothetical protein AB4Y77_11165 [Paenarthrobacter sp. YAF11_1]|uniref:hypothetical protein n=1 Tax=Paenarthrobacter sp. YAF11_1 TaxID=3233074 RepID=UPI003F9C094B